MPSKSYLLSIISILLLFIPSFSSQNFLASDVDNLTKKNQIGSLNNLCSPKFYLYSNGTCSPLCETPYTKTIQNGLLFCIISNSTTTDNLHNSRSLEQDITIKTNPVQYWNSLINSELVSYLTSSLTFMSYLLQPANPGPLIQVLASQIPATLEYLNINNLENMSSTSSIKMNLFGFDMPTSWKSNFRSTETIIPNSNYLVNDFRNLITYMLILALVGAFGITNYVRNKLKLEGKSLSQHLYTAFKWNIVLLVFFSGLSELVLFSVVELSTFKLQRLFNIISLLTSLLMIGVACLIMIKLFRITQEARKASSSFEAFRNKNKAFQVLFAGFSSNSLLNQRSLLIYLLRTIIVSAIIIPLYNYPLAQASVNVILSCAMMLFLILRRPFTNKLTFIQSVILELQLLLINLSVLALAINDETAKNIFSVSNILRLVLFIQNITIKSFVMISFIYNVFQAIKQRSNSKTKEPKIPNSLKLDTIQEEDVDQENENDNIRLFIAGNSNFTTPRNLSQTTQNTQWKKLRISGMIDLDIESDCPVPRTTRRQRHTQSGGFEPSDSQREAFTRTSRRVRTMKEDPRAQDQRGQC